MEPLSNRRPLAEELAVSAARRVAEARPIVMLDDPHEAVHEARRTAKELRGLLRLIRPAIEPVYAKYNARLREGARRLSESRDAAAIIESIDEHLVPNARGPFERMAVAVIRRRLVARRETLDEIWLRDAALDLLLALEKIPIVVGALRLDLPEAHAIAAGLTKTYRRGRRAMVQALRDDDPDVWHEWRKRAKYHRYHTELLLTSDPKVLKDHRTACKRLTDALGADHDLIALEEFLDIHGDLLGRIGRGTVRRLIRRRRAGLRREAARLGATVFGLPGRQLYRDTVARWEVYRPEEHIDLPPDPVGVWIDDIAAGSLHIEIVDEPLGTPELADTSFSVEIGTSALEPPARENHASAKQAEETQ